ncbi:hypothetical protein GDO86_006906 [Hymenochirus boettgeri]|uniref:Hexosyltransferase n=1 Tax=Hymenochirus boettgeri TaxID=247094 RepID=A0A8T2JCU8_9PIPI|nr:hypothetical protein GDO86_006906 [Hymenochirus boettgeri]
MNESRGLHLRTIRWKNPKFLLVPLFLAMVILISFSYHSSIKSYNIIIEPSTETTTMQPTSPNSTANLPKPTVPLYPYHIEEASRCKGEVPLLMLLIPSVPQDVVIRDTVRKTWANESLIPGISIKRVFLLGIPSNNETQVAVEQESSVFHDIVQQDFMDTYHNLTLKTLMGLEWVSRFCPQAKYVMKIDTDMFFNPWFLVRNILEPDKPTKVGFITGQVIIGASPFRDPNNKWYIPVSLYPENQYPVYCSGTGYVFSNDLSSRIYNVGVEIPIFPFEDVFVGMCVKKLGMEFSRQGGYYFSQYRLQYNGCHFTKMVTVHQYSSEDLVKLWPDFLKAMETCT